MPRRKNNNNTTKRQRDAQYEQSIDLPSLPPPLSDVQTSTPSTSLPVRHRAPDAQFFQAPLTDSPLTPRKSQPTKRLIDTPLATTPHRGGGSNGASSSTSSRKPSRPRGSTSPTPTSSSSSTQPKATPPRGKRARAEQSSSSSVTSAQTNPLYTSLGNDVFNTTQSYIAIAREKQDETALEAALTTINASLQIIPSSSQAMLALTYLGTAHLELFDHKEFALKLYHRAYDMFKNLDQSLQDLKTEALLLTNIGTTYWELKQSTESLTWFEAALALETSIESSELARLLTNYGNVKDDMNDPYGAIPLYQRALAIREAEGDELQIAVVLHNLGSVYAAVGDKSHAYGYYQRALLIREKVQGQDHADVADVLSNMSLVAEPADAITLSERAWTIKENAEFAVEDEVMAVIATNRGRAYLSSSDYTHAKIWLDTSIQKQASLQDHWQLHVETQMYLGELWLAEGDYLAAIGILEEANKEASRHDAHAILLAQIKLKLATAYYQHKAYSEANEICDVAEAIFKGNRFPEGNPFIEEIASLKGKISQNTVTQTPANPSLSNNSGSFFDNVANSSSSPASTLQPMRKHEEVNVSSSSESDAPALGRRQPARVTIVISDSDDDAAIPSGHYLSGDDLPSLEDDERPGTPPLKF